VPQYWILKTEPSEFSFDDLRRDGRARWDGVSNAVALKHLRAMRPGDQVLIYHTGDEKRLVGRAEVISEPYPDPSAGDERLVVVDIEPGPALPRPVTLAAIKADPAFQDFGLVRTGRLSVVPVPPALWQRLLGMAGLP
jgi:predicted RNA-binding protein with PUA-like domain